jgi:hypothetical protein
MRMHAFQRLLTGFAARWLFRCHGFLVALAMGLACFVPANANAQDSIHERPPLAWEEIERWIRRWSDVDEGPAWQQAWASIERAYLVFLEEEDRRRRVEGRALAEAYEPIASGIATPEEVERHHVIRSAHVDRCDDAEDAFLRSIRELLPATAVEAADALLRERVIERSSERHWSIGPEMHRIVGTMLDATMESESRVTVRHRVRSAQESMLPHVRALSLALADRQLILDRGRAREAWVPEAESEAAKERREERLSSMRAATEEAAARPTELAGKAFATIERIGTDAVMAMVATPGSPLNADDWRRVVDALGTPQYAYSVAGTLDMYRWRLDVILARYPPTDAARLVVAEATERFEHEARLAFVEGFRSHAEDAQRAEQHFRDLAAERPSEWVEARERCARRQSERFMNAFEAWGATVRSALGVPAESHWPRHERNADGEPIPEERPAHHRAESERLEFALGFRWTLDADDRFVAVHAFPAWATVEALALRLDLPPDLLARWKSVHEARAAAWVDSIVSEEAAIVAGLYEGAGDERTEELEAIRRGRDIASRARALRAALTEDLRQALREATALTNEAREAAEREIIAWDRRHRLADGRIACRRNSGLAMAMALAMGTASSPAHVESAPIAWSTNPFEAFDRLELSVAERGRITLAITDEAERLIRAAEATEDAAVVVAAQHMFRRVSPPWSAGPPVAVRRLARERTIARRTELLATAIPAARRRAAAAAALVEAMLAALPEAWRDDFRRANMDVTHPAIDAERPRFERPLLAALRQTASDPDRAARMVEVFAAWDQQWTLRAEEIARVGEGTSYALAVTGGWGQFPTDDALHAVSVVRWIEFRRRQESLVAMRAMERLLSAEERAALPRW